MAADMQSLKAKTKQSLHFKQTFLYILKLLWMMVAACANNRGSRQTDVHLHENIIIVKFYDNFKTFKILGVWTLFGLFYVNTTKRPLPLQVHKKLGNAWGKAQETQHSCIESFSASIL